MLTHGMLLGAGRPHLPHSQVFIMFNWCYVLAGLHCSSAKVFYWRAMFHQASSPVLHLSPCFNTPLSSKILLHTWEIPCSILAPMKLVFRWYLAWKTRATIDIGFLRSHHPCLSRREKLKTYDSLNPIPPVTTRTQQQLSITTNSKKANIKSYSITRTKNNQPT